MENLVPELIRQQALPKTMFLGRVPQLVVLSVLTVAAVFTTSYVHQRDGTFLSLSFAPGRTWYSEYQMWRPRVLLIDDHTLVLDAFRKLLEPEFEVVGAVSDSQSALSLAEDLKPDIIVLDIGMPNWNGLQAGPELKKRLPRTKLIVLTMNEDSDIARESLRLWASGYLLKKSAGAELVKAIREALRGHTYVTALTERQLEEDFIRNPELEHTRSLTRRQREVLKLLAEGRTMRETADALHVTPRTVAFHKYKIMEDFGLKTNSDLVKLALREKVV